MGKPYQSELNKLPETYRWAVSQSIAPLVKAIKTSAHLPLIAVGSGGSLSAAEVMVSCHEHYFGGIARSVTPLELISALPANGHASVWFFTASGGNIDIQRAFEHTLLLEPKQVSAIVGRSGSPMAKLLVEHQYADIFEFDLPSGRDGFLATSSLLAFSILICRGYSEALPDSDLPASFRSLLKKTLPSNLTLNQIEDASQSLWRRSTLHVLYSNELKAAAIDIESKFIEAGLCSVHLADFRNFAHGRHHWLAKHEDTSAILALSIPSDANLATQTIKLIPNNIPRLHIPVQTRGASAWLTGLILSLYLTGYAGNARKIDPGRPGVPSFGSKIYGLNTISGFLSSFSRIDAAIRRKVSTHKSLLSPRRKRLWGKAYHSFEKRLLNAYFGGIVMDYDGTVVDSRNRYDPPTVEMSKQIVRLLREGIVIGFATGRGKSIRNDLRSVIPKKFWGQVLVGYYNGAEISLLTDGNVPDGSSPPCDDLQKLLNTLAENIEIASLAKVAPRKFQLTIEPTSMVPETFLWELARSELCAAENMSENIYRSSHSIDILARGVSKVSVIAEVSKRIGRNVDVLTIGDRGKWPGNDSTLLTHIYSLSVDEVSFSKDTCWNVCPAGVRGPQGTLYYLSNLLPVPRLRFSAVKFSAMGE